MEKCDFCSVPLSVNKISFNTLTQSFSNVCVSLFAGDSYPKAFSVTDDNKKYINVISYLLSQSAFVTQSGRVKSEKN